MILPKQIKKHFSAITYPVKLGELLRTIDGYHGSIVVRQALKLMVRPSELNNAEWIEFDLDSSMWTIPAKRRKLPTHIKKANKPEDEHQHQVPLSSQAVMILEEAYQYMVTVNMFFLRLEVAQDL